MKYILSYFIIINIVSFILMYIDKKKAIRKQWRISENTLMLFSVIGGSLGMYVGMKIFRHKTKHSKFYIGVPIILATQVVILFYIFMLFF